LKQETEFRRKNWAELDSHSFRLKDMIEQFTTDIKNDYQREDLSRDESGLTRGDVSHSLSRSQVDASRFMLPGRSAV